MGKYEEDTKTVLRKNDLRQIMKGTRGAVIDDNKLKKFVKKKCYRSSIAAYRNFLYHEMDNVESKTLDIFAYYLRGEGFIGLCNWLETKDGKEALTQIQTNKTIIEITGKSSSRQDRGEEVFSVVENEYIPPRSNNYFISLEDGREEKMKEIWELLFRGKSVGITAKAGMGKTSLVREICYYIQNTRHRGYIPSSLIELSGKQKLFRNGIVWMHFEKEEALEVLIEQQIERRFNISIEGNFPIEQKLSKIKNIFLDIGDILIVMDNVEQNLENYERVKNEFQELTLLTSGRNKFEDVAPIELFGLSNLEAEEMLRHFYLLDTNDSDYIFPEKEQEEMDELIKMVTCHPLAVKLLALRGRYRKETISDLKQEYEQKKLEILKVQNYSKGDLKNRDISISFELSYEILSNSAKECLKRCCLFEYPFVKNRIKSNNSEEQRILEESFEELLFYGLIDCHSDIELTTHPLIREFVKTKIDGQNALDKLMFEQLKVYQSLPSEEYSINDFNQVFLVLSYNLGRGHGPIATPIIRVIAKELYMQGYIDRCVKLYELGLPYLDKSNVDEILSYSYSIINHLVQKGERNKVLDIFNEYIEYYKKQPFYREKVRLELFIMDNQVEEAVRHVFKLARANIYDSRLFLTYIIQAYRNHFHPYTKQLYLVWIFANKRSDTAMLSYLQSVLVDNSYYYSYEKLVEYGERLLAISINAQGTIIQTNILKAIIDFSILYNVNTTKVKKWWSEYINIRSSSDKYYEHNEDFFSNYFQGSLEKAAQSFEMEEGIYVVDILLYIDILVQLERYDEAKVRIQYCETEFQDIPPRIMLTYLYKSKWLLASTEDVYSAVEYYMRSRNIRESLKIPINPLERNIAIIISQQIGHHSFDKIRQLYQKKYILLNKGGTVQEDVKPRLNDIFSLELPLEIEDFSGKRMVLIPEGTFFSFYEDRKLYDAEFLLENLEDIFYTSATSLQPTDQFYLYSFYVDTEPVTNAEFNRFCEETKHPKPEYWATINFNPKSPVINISLNDIKAYFKWHNELSGCSKLLISDWESQKLLLSDELGIFHYTDVIEDKDVLKPLSNLLGDFTDYDEYIEFLFGEGSASVLSNSCSESSKKILNIPDNWEGVDATSIEQIFKLLNIGEVQVYKINWMRLLKLICFSNSMPIEVKKVLFESLPLLQEDQAKKIQEILSTEIINYHYSALPKSELLRRAKYAQSVFVEECISEVNMPAHFPIEWEYFSPYSKRLMDSGEALNRKSSFYNIDQNKNNVAGFRGVYPIYVHKDYLKLKDKICIIRK